MAEKTQQEIITLKGKLKGGERFWDNEGKILLKKSVNEDYYYSVPLIVSETEKNWENKENEFDSIMLIFWKKDFEKMQKTIADLKIDQSITVHGHLAGQDKNLLKVIELETDDNDEDIFV